MLAFQQELSLASSAGEARRCPVLLLHLAIAAGTDLAAAADGRQPPTTGTSFDGVHSKVVPSIASALVQSGELHHARRSP